MSAMKDKIYELYPHHLYLKESIPTPKIVEWCIENSIYDFDVNHRVVGNEFFTVICFDSLESRTYAALRWVNL